MQEEKTQTAGLERSLGLVTVTFYGLGTIVGAGIYVLLGSVAGLAGPWMPYAFLLAGLIAASTALSYAELSARLPQCAGASVYIQAAWQQKSLSIAVGWMLVLTGIVSAAAIANGFVGYLNEFIDANPVVAITGLVCGLGLIAALNMKASARLVLLVTLLEVSGLLLVIGYAWQSEPATPGQSAVAPDPDGSLLGVLLGSFVAFYAFIGFEDMVNTVEEVKNPRRNMPLAIIMAVLVSTLLYFLVAWSALRVLPVQALANSDAPLAVIMETGGGNRQLISLISLVAVVNGALVQIIMASRVLYGMSGRAMAPELLGRINPATHTPVVATVLIVGLILVFSLTMPITQLAQLTSFIMLVIFFLVNLALIRLKRNHSTAYDGICFPVFVPVCGAFLSLAMLLFQSASSLGFY
jgi:amino acid transporter